MRYLKIAGISAALTLAVILLIVAIAEIGYRGGW